MKREVGAPILSAIFVDYDNIYMSLRRKSEDAAKRFPKAAAQWLKAVENGRLITPSSPFLTDTPRRIVSIRCYGNPVPRRNTGDNSTDMNSFPFVRHHFLRAGFEVVDCPPLTSHQKNAADIRMVMDLRDFLTHETYFDEFVILSGDADFTPVLHRLRQHARRTVIYSNDHTASAYSAICDGEVREADLIGLLMAVENTGEAQVLAPPQAAMTGGQAGQLRIDDLRQMIIAEVSAGVRAASGPVPLEALADRALRAIGHERTIGTAWAGAGTFRDLLRLALPTDLRVTEQAPFYAYDPKRHASVDTRAEPLVPAAPRTADLVTSRSLPPAEAISPPMPLAVAQRSEPMQPSRPEPAPAPLANRTSPEPVMHRGAPNRPSTHAQAGPAQRSDFDVHRAMARIQEACQAPPLSPQDYRVLFDLIAQEINEHGISGAQTVSAILKRAAERGVSALRRQDVQFVLDVIGEADPWFEQAASASLFAGRFRNYVVARCREQGLMLSMKELDLIDSWFMGVDPAPGGVIVPGPALPAQRHPLEPKLPAEPTRALRSASTATSAAPAAARNRWWAGEEAAEPTPPKAEGSDEDFPRFVRSRR